MLSQSTYFLSVDKSIGSFGMSFLREATVAIIYIIGPSSLPQMEIVGTLGAPNWLILAFPTAIYDAGAVLTFWINPCKLSFQIVLPI